MKLKTKKKKTVRSSSLKKGTATRPAVSKRPKKAGSARSSSVKGTTVRDRKIAGIRAALVDQKERLLNEADSARNDLPGQILFPDMGDQASAEIDRNFMLRLRGREQKLLQKIESILDMIDSGTYGICESCGCEIGIERLEARPVTSLCIECKIEQEDEEKLRE